MAEFFGQLKVILTRSDRKKLLGLAALAIVISAVETVGVSAVMPFITIAGNFDHIHSRPEIAKLYDRLGFESEADFVVVAGLVLFAFYTVRAVINFSYLHLLARFSFGNYHRLTVRLFDTFLGMPYAQFGTRNRAHMSKSIINEAASIAQMMQALLILMSETFVGLSIYALLLWVDWRITLVLSGLIGSLGLILGVVLRRRIRAEGVRRESIQRQFYEMLNRTFGNYKLIKLLGGGAGPASDFTRASRAYADVNVRNTTMQHVPRLVFEWLGFGFVVLFVTYMVARSSGDISSMLGMLSVFVLGLYRLLPSVNRIVAASNELTFNARAMEVVAHDLQMPREELGATPVKPMGELSARGLRFGYGDLPVLREVNLELRRGDKIAFVGESGAGKTTLVDLLTGLLAPTAGTLSVDGIEIGPDNVRQWRARVGYVPQHVFLFDGTLGENVAFGRPWDEERLWRALEQADLAEFARSRLGLSTPAGDGGEMLSGGQRQRVAIARALYTDPDVIVLDEATSALDHGTEERIMEQLYRVSAGKTLLVIAHRLSTIDGCDTVYRVAAGRIERLDRGHPSEERT
jgi:ABC-type multidrug transport system fused ATPase/permease subunit